jgi:hypothetical protein
MILFFFNLICGTTIYGWIADMEEGMVGNVSNSRGVEAMNDYNVNYDIYN